MERHHGFQSTLHITIGAAALQEPGKNNHRVGPCVDCQAAHTNHDTHVPTRLEAAVYIVNTTETKAG